MTQPIARLLKVQVQPVFVVIDEDGGVHEVNIPPAVVAGVDWREFGTNSFDSIDLEAVAAEWQTQRGDGGTEEGEASD